MSQDKLDEITQAYRLFFNSPSGLIVLGDLMKLCKFRSEISDPVDEGRRRVFLHILSFSQLTDEQLFSLYAGRLSLNRTEPQDDD